MARRHVAATGALVVTLALVSGCGSSHHRAADQQNDEKVQAYAYLPSTHVQCAGPTCRLTATTRIHSQREAFLIAWPLIAGAVKDPSLETLKTIALKLSDPKTGAKLSLNCRRNQATQLPDQTSVAAMQKQCAWSWRASY